MYVLISVLIIIISILLIFIVLVQNSKGGGLAAGFASSNQYMGVRKTADFLEKATWTLAISLVILCLIISTTVKPEKAAAESRIEKSTGADQTTSGQPFGSSNPNNNQKAAPSNTTTPTSNQAKPEQGNK